MDIEMDHPRIRHDLTCPFCGGHKSMSLVACWPCFRKVKYEPDHCEAVLDAREAELSKPAVTH